MLTKEDADDARDGRRSGSEATIGLERREEVELLTGQLEAI